MSKTNLVAVLQKLIKEGPESAQDDLHQYFLETCVDINESFNETSCEDGTEVEEDSSDVAENSDGHALECDQEFDEDSAEDDTTDDINAGDDNVVVDMDPDDGDDSTIDIDAVGGDESDVGLEDKVEDLESQLADLQAQFMALTGQGPLDSETVEIDPEDDSDTLVTTDDGEESPIDGSEEDGDEEEEEATDESMTFEDEDFADLEEAYQLEKVQDPNLSGGKEIGANGQKISVNDKSPTLQKKVGDRIGGEPVEVISDEHSGYDREPSPGVKDVTIAKNQQKKANQELKGVSKEGDKSALINKNDGFGADNTKSPVVPTKSLQK